VPLQELAPGTAHRSQIGVSRRFAVIQPGQERQLCQQVVGRGAAVDLETEGVVVKLIFQHHFFRRPIQQPCAFQQRTSWLWQTGFE